MRNNLLLVLIILFNVIFVTIGYADTYRLEADEVYGIDNVSVTARGNVVFTFKDTLLKADEAVFFPSLRVVEANGNVLISDSIQRLSADRITYFLDNQTGVIDNVTGVLDDVYYICARTVTRESDKVFYMEDARVTSCSGPNPSWSFSFMRARANIDGYISGEHVSGNVKDMPLVYTPLMVYPLKVTRQTGLLVPTIGYSSGLGAYYSQDLFIAIDIDKDFTYRINSYTERGFQSLGEFRYNISNTSDMLLIGEYINDTDDKNGSDATSRWRYVNKTQINMPYDLSFVMDSDMVSDFLYMRDYGNFGMFSDRRENLQNVFNHEYRLGWQSKYSDLSVLTNESYKFVDNSSGGYIRTDLEQFPSAMARKFFIQLPVINMDYQVTLDNVKALDKEFFPNSPSIESSEKYYRFNSYLTLYKSLSSSFMTVTPSLTQYYTYWGDVDDTRLINNSHGDFLSRIEKRNNGYQRFFSSARVSANLNEIYKFYGEDKHGVLVTLQYEYNPDLDHSQLPDYLEYDNLATKNEISFNVRNYYRSKTFNADLSIIQRYDYLNDEPWRPLLVNSLVSKKKVFSNFLELNYDYNANRRQDNESKESFSFLSNTATLYYGIYSLGLSYIYDRDSQSKDYNTSLQTQLLVRLNNLSFNGDLRWQANNDFISLDGLVPISQTVGVAWKDQCYQLGLTFGRNNYLSHERGGVFPKTDYTVELMISLSGIGTSSARIFKGSKFN